MKKNTLYKIVCIMLCVILATGVAGCGCGKGKDKNNSNSKTEQSGDKKDSDSETSKDKNQNADKKDDEEANKDSANNNASNSGDVDNSTNSSDSNGSGDNNNAAGTNNSGSNGNNSNQSDENVPPAKTMEVPSETPKKGEEFVITVQAGKGTPVAAYTLELEYDKSKLEVLEYGRTKEFKDAYTGISVENDKGGAVVFTGVNTNAHQQYYGGDMVYVKFKAIGASGSVSDVTLKVKEAVDLAGNDSASSFTVKSGTVTIK